jgi:hypothetical protein
VADKHNITREQRRLLKTAGLKHCRKCEEDKPLSSFVKCKSRHDGLDPVCRQCNSVSAADYRKRYRDILLDRGTAKREANRDKMNADARRRYDPEKESARHRRKREKHPEKIKESSTRWRRENAEKSRAYHRAYRLANPEKKKAYTRTYGIKNKEKIRLKNIAYQERNRERIRLKSLEYNRKNRAALNARTAKRNAAKLRAIPAWADMKAIAAIYAESARLTKETGILHEVDHIYPLQSKWMCGLHVETNLQILPRRANRSKSNNYWPGMEWSVGRVAPSKGFS